MLIDLVLIHFKGKLEVPVKNMSCDLELPTLTFVI